VSRAASIRTGLEEGRKALEASGAQLRIAEEKLARLEDEIRELRASAAHEMEAERARWRRVTLEEAGRIAASARAQMEAAVRAARLELKRYGAGQAVAHAAALIQARLGDEGREQLVARFVSALGTEERRN